MRVSIRKVICFICIITLAFSVGFCLVTGREIPPTANTIITALIGFVGYYFGKSTALEGVEENNSNTGNRE